MTPRRQPKVNAQTPLEMVDRMTVLATRLKEVLSAESEVLKSQDLKKVSEFHEEKTRLANELAGLGSEESTASCRPGTR